MGLLGVIKLETVSTIVATRPFCLSFFVPVRRVVDFLVPLLVPDADLEAELRPFVVEPVLEPDRVDFLFLEPALPARPFAAEPAREREAADLDEPVFELPVAREDLGLDEDDDFVREEAADVDFFDLDVDVELPLDLDKVPVLEAPLAERPDFDAVPFEAGDFPDFELDDFDPPVERPDAERPDDDFLEPEELFEVDDLPDEPDLVPVAFLVADFDPEDLLDPDDDDFDPEDFFVDDDFDPDDFLVSAMILIPRSVLIDFGRPSIASRARPTCNLDQQLLSSWYLSIRRT